MEAISAEIAEITKMSTKLEIEIPCDDRGKKEQAVKNDEGFISFIIDYRRYLHVTGSGICAMKKLHKDKRTSCKKSYSICSNSQFVKSLHVLLLGDLEHGHFLKHLSRKSLPSNPELRLLESLPMII